MTLHNANSTRPTRRPSLRAGALGLAIGLVVAFGAADAAQAGRVVMAQAAATAPTTAANDTALGFTRHFMCSSIRFVTRVSAWPRRIRL